MGIINLWKKTRKSNAEYERILSDRKVGALLNKIDNKGYTPADEEITALKKVERTSFLSGADNIPKSIDLLTNLKELDLSYTKINDLRGIKNLTNLQGLNLSVSRITNLSGIENLTNLQRIDLICTKINDLSRIKNLANLQELNLDETDITDISGIENLTNLRWLVLSNTNITDLSGIENLTNLQWLDLSETLITDLSGIENLTNLQGLWLRDTQIDSHELKRLSKLKKLTLLDLTYLELEEIPPQLLELNLPFDTTYSYPLVTDASGIYLHGTVLTQQNLSLFEQDRSLIEEYYKSEIASVGGAEETKNL